MEHLTTLITPQSLFKDNHSDEASNRRATWYRARREGNLIVLWTCGDARIITPYENSLLVRSIATGGEIVPYKKLLNDPRVRGIMIVNHFAGPADPGIAPKGCGGLAAKGEMLNGSTDDCEKGISRYIKNNVKNPDLLMQTYSVAEAVAAVTNRPILAAAQDHLTGSVCPIAVFLDNGELVRKSAKLGHLFQGQYDPAKLYADGLPVLDVDKIPNQFHDILEESESLAISLRKKYDLRALQTVQNPRMIVLSTGVKPLQVRYPETFDYPGIAFQLSLPRRVIEPGQASLEDFEAALDQAEYPISHTIKNVATPEKAFGRLDTFLIETGNMDLSAQLARILLEERPWAKEWAALPNRQILIAEMNRGVVHRIERFDWSAARLA